MTTAGARHRDVDKERKLIELDGQRWVQESLGADMRRLWRVDEVLWEDDTSYQHVLIGRTGQGISLFCDNDRQSTEFSQIVYHEAMMVPGFLLAEKIDNVLIVGSSEGVASRMAVDAGATRVDHVDIDQECVRACAEHLPYGYTPTELAEVERGEGAVRLHYADGWSFLEQALGRGDRYDLIVVDLPDESAEEADSQHNRLYGVEFIRRCHAVLAPGGVIGFQAGSPTVWRNTTLVRAYNRFRTVFDTVTYFGSDEHEWSFLFGRVEQLDDPVNVMLEALPQCSYQPASLDDATLIGSTVPPYSVRHQD
ncbi:spermidine synthase [Halopolyspora algeriensis]|uniref:Polyamine aminopropyltransferase n=1 Tax=Halopolyspora algeriensis TaxID=1500506 RepID=A0A368VU03_9ACTN|nr:spermidine synthase [Halopolyspora algeriensis]TQM56598.1 spermidine synthase [Halopolyspora algeriensis]